MTGDGSNFVVAQQLSLSIPAEDGCIMRKSDLRKIKRRLERLERPVNWWDRGMSACFGIALTGFLAFLAWLPAEDSLTPAALADYRWLKYLYLYGAIALAVVGVVCLIAGRDARAQVTTSVRDLIEDLDEVADRVPAGPS